MGSRVVGTFGTWPELTNDISPPPTHVHQLYTHTHTHTPTHPYLHTPGMKAASSDPPTYDRTWTLCHCAHFQCSRSEWHSTPVKQKEEGTLLLEHRVTPTILLILAVYSWPP